MKLNQSDHIAIAETNRDRHNDKAITLNPDTIEYWQTVAKRKYWDGMILGLRLRRGYDRPSGTEKET